MLPSTSSSTTRTSPPVLVALAAATSFGVYAWFRRRQHASTMKSSTTHHHIQVQSATPNKDVIERTSFANFQEARCTHGKFYMDVDMQAKRIKGHVTWTVALRANAKAVVFDVRTLNILSCSQVHDTHLPTTKLDFTMSQPADPIFGSALTVNLAHDKITSPQEIKVKIDYETTSDSMAMQFLDPVQTANGTHPFLFTQSQAIHARSFVPCQDAPAVKCTWEASVTVPMPLTALMSGLQQQKQHDLSSPPPKPNHHTFYFEQRVPVCSYLIALVVGNVECRDLGPRTRVWAEPSVIEAAAYEFADVGHFVNTAEMLLGPYVWTRYDFIVLPKSFPYGGMEDPNLTLLTPTLLAGDRSLVDVLLHELAHSWTGNLVTNATWEDFWLNEGWTVFCERRLVLKLYGAPRSGLKTVIGRRHLEEDVARIGPDHYFTRLHIPSDCGDGKNVAVDPDDSFSSVPYEKGADFLEELERRVGGPTIFEPFVKRYVSQFQFGLVSSKTFASFFDGQFPGVMSAQDWDMWLNKPGMPPPPPAHSTDTTLVDMAESCANEWCKTGHMPAMAKTTSGWSSDQIVVFLERVLALQASAKQLPDQVIDTITTHFKLRDVRNAEIRLRFYTLTLRSPQHWRGVCDLVIQFLGEQGRMKYVRPMFRELNKVDPKLANETFAKLKSGYHGICAKMVAGDLGV